LTSLGEYNIGITIKNKLSLFGATAAVTLAFVAITNSHANTPPITTTYIGDIVEVQDLIQGNGKFWHWTHRGIPMDPPHLESIPLNIPLQNWNYLLNIFISFHKEIPINKVEKIKHLSNKISWLRYILYRSINS